MTPEAPGMMRTMHGDAPDHQFTSDLNPWQVTLATGDVLDVRAHGVKEVEGLYVFIAIMEGTPVYEYELLRIPTAAVAEVLGG